MTEVSHVEVSTTTNPSDSERNSSSHSSSHDLEPTDNIINQVPSKEGEEEDYRNDVEQVMAKEQVKSLLHGKEGEEEEDPIPELPQWRMFTMSALWFCSTALSMALPFVTVPAHVQSMVGKENKGSALGTLKALAAVATVVVTLISGPMSDRTSSRIGRRLPYIIVGAVAVVISLIALEIIADSVKNHPSSTASSVFPLYATVYLLMQASLWLMLTPYHVMLPDLVPPHQQGLASGILGLSNLSGSLFGALSGGFMTPVSLTYTLSSLILLSTLLLTIFNREDLHRAQKAIALQGPFDLRKFLGGFLEPLRDSDFRWVWITRWIMQLGFVSISSFIFYYVGDVVPRPYMIFQWEFTNPAGVTGLFIAISLTGAVATAYPAGVIADVIGKKKVIYVSAAFQVLASCLLALSPGARMVIILSIGIFFGFGVGAYTAVDFALASECLPSKSSQGKDMAIWSLSMPLADTLGSPLAGVALDVLQKWGTSTGNPTLGYRTLYGACALLLCISNIFVYKISKGNAPTSFPAFSSTSPSLRKRDIENTLPH